MGGATFYSKLNTLNIKNFGFSKIVPGNLASRGGLAIWTFWRSPERPSIQRSSKKKCQIKWCGVSIYSNSAHQCVIGLVNITKDG